MDKQGLKNYLIKGGLIDILKRGQDKPARIWITQDASGFLLSETPSAQPDGNTVGGEIVAQNALRDGYLFEPAKEAIIEFLAASFGLTKNEAEHVYIQVSEGQ